MRSFLHLDLDVAFRDADAVACDGLLRRRADDLASSDVERCAMQRTGHLVARDRSFSQRASPVRAGVVEREELTIDIEEGNALTLIAVKITS